MSKSIILDWQKNSLMLARASGRMPKATIEKVILKNVGGTEVDSQTAAEALRAAATELGVKGEVTVLVARESVEMRTVQIPKIDADETPDVIRFQAQRQFASMTDAWTVDYVLLPPSTTSEMQTALVAAISPVQLAEIESACASAGLQATKITLRPLQTAQMAIDGGLIPSGGQSVVVCISESVVDILIMRDGKVVQVRTTKLPSESELVAAALQSEIRRSLFAATNELDGKPIEQALLIATANRTSECAKVVEQAAGVKVVQFLPESLLAEPNTSIADSAANRLIATAGALTLGGADRGSVIDFKNPKKRPPKKRDTRKYLLPIAAGAAVVIFGIGWYYSTVSELNSQLTFAQDEIKTKKLAAESAQRRVNEVNLVQKFAQDSPNWLDELAYLAEKLPSSEKIMIDSPNFKLNQNTGTGEITFNLLSNEKADSTAFRDSLHNEHYTVSQKTINELSPAEQSKTDGKYKWRSTSSITVLGKGWDLNTPPHKFIEDNQPSDKSDDKSASKSSEGRRPSLTGGPTKGSFGSATRGRPLGPKPDSKTDLSPDVKQLAVSKSTDEPPTSEAVVAQPATPEPPTPEHATTEPETPEPATIEPETPEPEITAPDSDETTESEPQE